jgi:hypothetical protein
MPPSTLPIVPPPHTIDLASEDIVEVDLEKYDDEDDNTGSSSEKEEGDTESIEVDADTKTKTGSNKSNTFKKGCCFVFVGILIAVAVIIGAVVGTKDERAAKNAGSSSAADVNNNVYACSATATSTCPALVGQGAATDNKMTAIQVGRPIYGEDTQDLFGMALGVNCDGTIVAVGSSQHSDRSGHVKIYRWVSDNDSDDDTPTTTTTTSIKNTWIQLGRTLEGNSGSADQFGYSISLSSDGLRLAVGVRFADTVLDDGTTLDNVGTVQVFQFMDEDWQHMGEIILGEAADDQSGRSLDFNWDGSRLIVGASGNDGTADNAGHARVFEWKVTATSSEGGRLYGWEQLGNDIDGEAAEDSSGNAVAISADGNVVAVGAFKNDASGAEDAGHVRVFAYDDDVADFVQMGQDIDGSGSGDWTGLSLALSGSGTRLVVGAPGSNDRLYPGVSRVYDYVNGAWTQQGADLYGGGYSVDISFDGNRVALGSHRGFSEGPNSGQVFIYEAQAVSSDSTSTPVVEWLPILGEETPIVGEAGSMFGTQVGLSSDGMRVVSSSPATNGNGTDNSLTFVGSVTTYDLCPVVG